MRFCMCVYVVKRVLCVKKQVEGGFMSLQIWRGSKEPGQTKSCIGRSSRLLLVPYVGMYLSGSQTVVAYCRAMRCLVFTALYENPVLKTSFSLLIIIY